MISIEAMVALNAATTVAVATFQLVWNHRQLKMNDTLMECNEAHNQLESRASAKIAALDIKCIRLHEANERLRVRLDALANLYDDVASHRNDFNGGTNGV